MFIRIKFFEILENKQIQTTNVGGMRGTLIKKSVVGKRSSKSLPSILIKNFNN